MRWIMTDVLPLHIGGELPPCCEEKCHQLASSIIWHAISSDVGGKGENSAVQGWFYCREHGMAWFREHGMQAPV